jgi:hypothetical protein
MEVEIPMCFFLYPAGKMCLSLVQSVLTESGAYPATWQLGAENKVAGLSTPSLKTICYVSVKHK